MRTLLLTITILLSVSLFSQNYNFGYRVEFKDKGTSAFTTENPSAFLSERAIMRRERMNIPITEEDFPVSKIYLNTIQEQTAAKLWHTSKWLNSSIWMTNSTSFIELVEGLEFVASVELVYTKPLVKTKSIVNSTVLGAIDYSTAANQIEMLNLDKLHAKGNLGKGIQIAVIDAGFMQVNTNPYLTHLYDDNRLLGTRDFAEPGTSVYGDDSHGANVLTIIAGRLENTVIGSAPEASFWLLRSEVADYEMPIEEENWIAAAEFADSAGVDIVTTSLGYSEFDSPFENYTHAELDGKTARISKGAAIAFSKGMFLLNSAGNSGNDPWEKITFPADVSNVLTVGAVDEYGQIASFSSVGPNALGEVKPDIVAKGLWTTYVSSVGSETSGHGTSYSTPLVAGAVACLMQGGVVSNFGLLQIIRESADRYTSPDNMYGYGIPDFYQAWLNVGDVSSITKEQNPLVFFDANNTLCVLYKGDTTGDAEVSVISMQGKVMFREDKAVTSWGSNFWKIGLVEELASGNYILRVLENGKASSVIFCKD
jgi:serine protease AprX